MQKENADSLMTFGICRVLLSAALVQPMDQPAFPFSPASHLSFHYILLTGFHGTLQAFPISAAMCWISYLTSWCPTFLLVECGWD